MPFTAPQGALPSLTIDCAIFGFIDFQLKILLVKRDIEPLRGTWSVPGGWIGRKEGLDEAAQRILYEATGLNDIYMDQLRVFGRLDRFPIERLITIGYTALINPDDYPNLQHGAEVSEVRWFDADKVPQLTFDHNEIVEAALENLKNKAKLEPISFELLPHKFTLPQIRSLYESILGEELDRRNFRRKILSMGILEKLPEKQTGGAHRAPQLYQFDKENYRRTHRGLVLDF